MMAVHPAGKRTRQRLDQENSRKSKTDRFSNRKKLTIRLNAADSPGTTATLKEVNYK